MDTRKVKAMEIRLDELSDDPITREQLCQEFWEKGMKLLEHARVCEKWQEEKGAGRARELHKLRQERLFNFKTRLAQIGWSDSILENINWRRFPTMNHSNASTSSRASTRRKTNSGPCRRV
ncbi:hypothetical protein BS47DRAFT_716817 [Hydnum rufescens UP504]|uniref:Uncharacterized protein n=1 Tax=Hydnum rufescens UP504 TaxID=1448309 RepID=A0A9P6DV61_9AGAM|nr:hypothetical protein BS47DRAFT_716817 [Hydnum rufescens UP504]